MSITLPQHVQAIVIGGGVIGASTAYHLAKLGWKDVLVLERDRLTSGTTWHAAGLIASAGMSSETLSWIFRHSHDLYQRLEAETGISTGFRQCGHLHLASNRARQESQRREINFNRLMGMEKHEVSPAEVKDMFPMLEAEGLLSAIWSPKDGRANPVDVTMSLAAGARKMGVRFVEGCPVTDIVVERGRARAVDTPYGRVTADAVVLATGMWSRQLGAKIGVPVPLQAMEHYYLLTEPLDGVHPMLPVVEDPESYAYVREEGGGLLFGLFEPDGAPWMPKGVPNDASFSTLAPDWDRMTPHLEHAFRRFPVMEQAGIKSFFCGPESFTPDGGFLVGESPEVAGLYLATGLNSLGVLSGGGVGALIAEEIVEGVASQDMTGLTPARLGAHEATQHYLMDRLPHSLAYIFRYASLPNWKHKSARGARRLALHDRYAAKGAYFATLSGWEMPYWFARGDMPKVAYEYGRQEWFHLAGEEHRATREAVGLFDKSFMGKFIVQGRDAEAVLNRVSANSVSVPVGNNVYTQWLNPKGGILSDLTVTRLAEDQFLLVTGDVLQRVTAPWLKKQIASDEFCTVTDVTSAYTILSLQGPKSRALLATITGADLSTEALPFRGSTEVEIGYARVLMVRVTYMGELGYEIYIPTEQSLNVYDALVAGIEAQGIECRLGGLLALDSLRLEKGYRDFGVDIDNTDTPLEAGLGFVVDLDKGAFIGREVLAAQKAAGPLPKRLLPILLDDPEPLLLGNEPLYADGRAVGYVRAGAFGHSLGASVGLAIVERPEGVTAEWLKSVAWTVLVNDRLVAARVQIAPFYDPKSERVRA